MWCTILDSLLGTASKYWVDQAFVPSTTKKSDILVLMAMTASHGCVYFTLIYSFYWSHLLDFLLFSPIAELLCFFFFFVRVKLPSMMFLASWRISVQTSRCVEGRSFGSRYAVSTMEHDSDGKLWLPNHYPTCWGITAAVCLAVGKWRQFQAQDYRWRLHWCFHE